MMEENEMRIAIDCDDASLALKRILYDYIRACGYDVTDLDALGATPGAMYPQIGFALARRIAQGEFDRGVLLCGTGLGMAMSANKVQGIYAGVCHDVYSAERLVRSNNAQVLTMGARVVGPELAKCIVAAWLIARFDGGGSLPKVEQMRALEHASFKYSRDHSIPLDSHISTP
ncbi:ribose-5-phosphate isomerase [Clostridia bacterium]|nr:ribose-5-phosphate isomerase [Clostridia bacterium]